MFRRSATVERVMLLTRKTNAELPVLQVDNDALTVSVDSSNALVEPMSLEGATISAMDQCLAAEDSASTFAVHYPRERSARLSALAALRGDFRRSEELGLSETTEFRAERAPSHVDC